MMYKMCVQRFRGVGRTCIHKMYLCQAHMALCALHLPPLANINNMFENWLNGIDKTTKARIRVGVCALMWAICLSQ
jgi:hypothetical protein